MRPIPCIPPNAPFNAEQRAWLNGYLAGLFADASATGPATANAPAAPAAAPAEPLLILFGSQTGSAEGLAKRVAREASGHGYAPRVLPLNEFAAAGLEQAARLLIISSTWGDGDPPDNAVAFWTWLSAANAPRLANLHYAVLGLGDRNYAEFCGASKKFDARLEALGARRVHPRGECDVDYEAAARAWLDQLWPALRTAAPGPQPDPPVAPVAPSPAVTQTLETPAAGPSPAKVVYSRAHPFPARLRTNRKLNRGGSAKEVRHFEISLGDSGLNYEVGDALGVVAQNDPQLVDDLLATLGFTGDEHIKTSASVDEPIRLGLLRDYVITHVPPSLLQAFAERGGDPVLKGLLDPARKAELDAWLYGRDVLDVARALPRARFTPAEIAGFLRKLQPRLYSISSSPKAHPGEVHLTIGAVRYEAHGRLRGGVCSTFLADRVVVNQTPVPVFVQVSHGFRLPADADRPVIMIGPGTGIAPFRAFLEERQAIGARGRNWLFFGDQRRTADFYYEEQLTALQADGFLTRLDLAFSRDQAEKIYVQNRMLENAAEFWAWLEAGAHVYVCGDAKRMAKDVDAALREIIVQAGGRTPEQADTYVQDLKREKRYQRDVY